MHDEPAAELLSVADPEADLASLAAEVQRAAAAKRDAGLYAGVAAEADGAATAGLRFGPRTSPAASSAEILPYGGPVSAPKRLLRRALHWLLWPITAQASRHNQAVDAVLAEHERQVAWLRMEIERLNRDGGAAR